MTLGIGWLCAFCLRVLRQAGTVSTTSLGMVPGLLDHVGSSALVVQVGTLRGIMSILL